jgi:putative flippase GtrA
MTKIHENPRHAILRTIDFFYPVCKKFMSLQTFRYAACGGANTLLDISLFSMFYNLIYKNHLVHLGFATLSPHIAALFSALCISLPTGFYLNRYVVFQHAGLKGHVQLFRYILVVVICIVFNYVFLKFFVDYLGWYPTISKAVTTLLIVIFSYTSQTFYFFRAKKGQEGS